MFTIIYRWHIKPEFERQFVENWSAVTKYYMENHKGLGSRLHRGSDGVWYAYAQWESEEARAKAFKNVPEMPEREKMREAIIASLPEIRLEVEADFLILPERIET
jgi:heme-degrading monooxygenase HmoA